MNTNTTNAGDTPAAPYSKQKESIRNNTTKGRAHRGSHQEKRATKRIPKLVVKSNLTAKRGKTAEGCITNSWLLHRQVLKADLAKEVHKSTVEREERELTETQERVAQAKAARVLLGVE